MHPGLVPPAAAAQVDIVDWGRTVNCADDVCVAGCDSRAECDPGGYGEFADSKKCPLNVCCSKFGFCGTTKDFCGNKKVKRPSCSKTKGVSRVVGYYEGWSMNRACNVFYPDQIPTGVYTHLNYAFATIDPETFEVLAPNSYERDMMKRLTALKKFDPDLKVFVAVGGWTFNDPGPTATVFSDIARSEANQKAFFRSLISFMSTYDFDGIDLDWEYPVADDRSGRPEDYKNFPSFIANLKKALKASGGRDGLTLTLPASFWYLQHFDIVKLQDNVDFFNIMSYDLHGAWDRQNKWLAPELNSHTNLTEITNALDLLWRNNISPDKVVLGLAFYARVFSATSPDCMSPGCTFESGGNAGKCSSEVGILLNSEIVDIMDDRAVKPQFDKDAAVKILSFDNNQWLTYDDAETFKLKAEFASGQCLGGLMVWAVSHDLPYGNFSRAVGEVANRKVKAIALPALSDDLETQKVHKQCKWTDCGKGCPAGWSFVSRSGGHEGMIDHSGCPDGYDHYFCCPSDSKQPTCGWYGHRNGKCNGRDNCPAGTIEIGSNSQHCNNNDYQAACCTYDDIPSLALFSQCAWGESPKCDLGSCSGSTELVANSSTGSGGDYCRYDTFRYTLTGQEATYHPRKYCCDQIEDTKWEDCEWHGMYGSMIVNEDTSLDGYCWSNCPHDTVRVALETRNDCDAGDGGRAMCCTPKHVTTLHRPYNEAETRMEQLVEEFMDNPSCGIDDYQKRDHAVYANDFLDTDDGNPNLVPRASIKAQETIQEMLQTLILSYQASSVANQIWQVFVVEVYPHLTIENIRYYIDHSLDWVSEGSWSLVLDIVCNMASWNAKLGDEGHITFGLLDSRSLVKRATTYTFVLSNGRIFVARGWDYRALGRWPANHPIWNMAFTLAARDDCFNANVQRTSRSLSNRRGLATEHIPEQQTIRNHAEDVDLQRLPSRRAVPPWYRYSTAFLEAIQTPMLVRPPPMTGGNLNDVPVERMMNEIGSTSNDGGFVLLDSRLNGVKERLWSGSNPTRDSIMQTTIDNREFTRALDYLREPIAVVRYLNHPLINSNLGRSYRAVQAEWVLADNTWVLQGNPRQNAGMIWAYWVNDHLSTIGLRAGSFVTRWGRLMNTAWANESGPEVRQVREAIESLMDEDTTVNQDDLNLGPTSPDDVD
ncbi:hypothetical protein BJY04DRAFT_223740 [Aspergillus karnatakaensis]|uniref:uncharacterized protein n=1 Tax=Aspergillus karnatakaensis TaxID=1810916 RepID=UPI003CCDE45E